MNKVTIYTDGACSGNPGPGGWAAILMAGGKEVVLVGGEADSTNNRMELTAVIKGLQRLNRPCEVDLYTDSQYVSNGINLEWLEKWKDNGWKRQGGKLLNKELWQELYELLQTHKVTFHWVKGHSDNENNNRCDKLAVAEIKKYRN